ncbi:MAG: M6 family metalloprotease domain-containing protein [Prevotella sp.]|nr:M6 family metalloprotease domain-containing protein [Prevotella sp.]
MKKITLLFVMLFVAYGATYAVPARRGITREGVLADGGRVVLTLCGDEYSHYWTDEDGNSYTLGDDNTAVLLSAGEAEEIRAKGALRKAERNAKRQKRLVAARAGKAKYTGVKYGLVILVNFLNKEMASATAQTDFDKMFNEVGYSENNHIGSVADYFSDQSYGQFDIVFDVIGPVTVSQNYAYYGQDYGGEGNDKYPCTMVAEACRLADDEVDFSRYDWDGDGEVEQVFIVYAGYGQNNNASSNTIWPHEWELSSGKLYGDGDGALTLDGVTVDTYAVACELAGNSGSTPAGIGVACHEFSHCLGYPDFYDTSYSGGWGMQGWDVLDSGSYNGPGSYNGEVPAGYTAYERWEAGWLEPAVLKEGMKVSAMEPLNDTPEAYILYNDNDANEYYLLENRQSDRWFRYVEYFTAPSGLLVTHVDYDAEAWANNTPNDNSSHQRMTVIQANNEKGTYRSGYYYLTQSQYAGHVYPYNDNDSLSALSTPAASLYNANTDGTKYMNKGIYGITLNTDGTISFSCAAVSQSGQTDTSGGDAGDSASGDVIFYESFDQCAGKGGNDGIWSGISKTYELVPDNDGWFSDCGFGAYQCARFGTGTYDGICSSPYFTLYGDAVLTFKIGVWDNQKDNNSVTVMYGSTYLATNIEVAKGEWTELSYKITGNGTNDIVFSCDGRFFLDEVRITTGNVSAIRDVNISPSTSERIYNLSGQYVGTDFDALPAGMYIRNNRKIVKK